MDLYCKIFVGSDLSRDELFTRLAAVVRGEQKVSTLYGEHLELDVRPNKDHDPARFEPNYDGFVYSPFFLETEPREGASEDPYIEAVGEVLESLWQMGASAVAACDFESRLPRKGGLVAAE